MNLFFCLVMEYHQKKKMTGNCIIVRSAWYKVSVIFWGVIAPSSNKTNKFIPYHFITCISKHKYYNIKLDIFHDLFLHYILWRLIILWRLNIYVTDFFWWHKITPIFQPIEKRVTWKIKWFIYNFIFFLPLL
jgi:hypothetical protein